jgi:hypothetical protein
LVICTLPAVVLYPVTSPTEDVEPCDIPVFGLQKKHLAEKQSATDANVRWAINVLNWLMCRGMLKTVRNLIKCCQCSSDDFNHISSKHNYRFNVFGSVHLCTVQWNDKLMQFLIVFISYLINTQHVSSDIRSSAGVLFTVHTASGYLRCYLSVALSCKLVKWYPWW